MHEPLTTQLVVELLQKLLAAFPRNLGSQNPTMMADVYRNGLGGIEGEAVRAATDIAIQNDQYFPKVARLRELATEWTRRNRATASVGIEPAWDVCAVCGARVKEKFITRQARHPDAPHPLLWDGLDDEGKPIPRMETLKEPRWVIEHDARRHNVIRVSEEGAA